MANVGRSVLAILWLLSVPARGGEPVPATVETTLATHDGRIRQFALDGDEATFFASENGPTADDHFTIVLDRPVVVKSIAAMTGRPEGDRRVVAGTLDVSTDGRAFRKLASFADGKASGGPVAEPVRAIRIKPAATDAPIAVREVAIVSDPPVAVFKYPVEFVVNASDAPELKRWAEQAARTCERAYPMINHELGSDGFRPPHVIRLTLSRDYRGVAGTAGDRIVGSVEYFRKHPDDVGAMVHETVHVVQAYGQRNNPHWLVEGVSDYIRFFKFEPGKIGRIDARTAHYDNSYRVSAAFLAYLVEKYDREIVRKLNAAMREGRYDDNLIQQITGKPQGELDDEWRATLRP
jgi:hypothetical protein